MDENVTGMQMNLFLWAKYRERAIKAESAKLIDARELFGYRRGLAIGERYLREEDGIVLHDPKEPIQLDAWRHKA
jgi:hypothetical protein